MHELLKFIRMVLNHFQIRYIFETLLSCLGFHIQFDKSVSMIEPKWIEDSSTWPSVNHESDSREYRTCLKLLLDENTQRKVAKLKQDIEESFEGKLLLFLGRLSRMVFEDHRQKPFSSIELVRRPHRNWTILETLTNSSRRIEYWLLQKVELKNPHETRMGVVVNSTELIIAFKFVEDREEEISRQRSPDEVFELIDYSIDETEESIKMQAENLDSSTIEKVAILQLDTADELQPIYAFLPTLTKCFKFVVQGDFILSTSRESIMENNPWNRMLLEKIPAMFVDAIVLMFLRAWNHSGLLRQEIDSTAEDVTHGDILDQLDSYEGGKCRVEIQPMHVIDLIPISGEHLPPSLQGSLKDIYKLLNKRNFLLSSHGELTAPENLCAVHHLLFEPSVNKLIPENLLFAATKKKFVLHKENGEVDSQEHCEFYLNDDVAKLLGIKFFSSAEVVKCLDYISNSGAVGKETDIAGCFLTLALLASQIKNQNKHSLGARHSNNKNTLQVISPADVKRLSELKLWSLQGRSELEAIDGKVFFIQEQSDSFNKRQMDCFTIFQSDLLVMEPKIFDAAENLIPNKGRRLLVEFLTGLFKSTQPISALTTKAKGGVTQVAVTGIHTLSPEMVVNSIVLPALKEVSIMSNADRVRISAYVAFYFLTIEDSMMGTKSVPHLPPAATALVIPTLTAIESGDEIIFDKPRLRPMRYNQRENSSEKEYSKAINERGNAIDLEVHWGFEFPNSATATFLTNKSKLRPVARFLGEVEWTIVDPLVSVFALGLTENNKQLIASNVKSTEMEKFFSLKGAVTTDADKSRSNWKEFLSRLGVVDFYGIYRGEIGFKEAPQLYRFLGHLLQDSKVIRTSWADDTLTERMHCLAETRRAWLSGIKYKISEQSEPLHYVPIFLPFYLVDSEVQPALSVSFDSYCMLQEIAYFVSTFADPKASYIQDLRKKSWLPVCMHPILSSQIKKDFSSEHYIVASPVDFFAGVGKNPWAVNVHGAYTLDPNIFDIKCEPLVRDVVYYGRSTAFETRQREKPQVSNQFDALIRVLELRKHSGNARLSVMIAVRMIDWMSQQHNANQPIYSKMELMQSFYNYIASEEFNDTETDRFFSLLSNDAAVVWVPSQAEIADAHVPGAMFKLSKLVFKDDSGLSEDKIDITEDLDVQLYSRYYSENFFAVEQVCRSCLSKEGSCGVFGGMQKVIEEGKGDIDKIFQM